MRGSLPVHVRHLEELWSAGQTAIFRAFRYARAEIPWLESH
jgi:hypothetical protein